MILCIIQARCSSARFPGKVLKPILGEPMLVRQYERIKRSKKINKVLIATSSDSTDDLIESACSQRGIECFRGDLEDVLNRFYKAALPFAPEHVVRATGDNPLADPELIDAIIDFHIDWGNDYTSNTIEPTYPDGLDVEVFRFECLEKAWKESELPSHREHVTPFIHQQPETFKLGNFREDKDLSSHRWTVDEPEDFKLVSSIYEKLFPQNPRFSMKDILILLAQYPELESINRGFERNEGLRASLQKDGEFFKKKE